MLTDRSLSEAVAAAHRQGFEVAVVSSQPTDALPKDWVISQTPAVSSRLQRGTTVKVMVGAGLRPPNVVGQPVDQARGLLGRAGPPPRRSRRA